MTTISRPFASFAWVIAGPAGLPCARAEGFRKTLSRATAVSPKDIPAIAFECSPSLEETRGNTGWPFAVSQEGLSKYRMEFQKTAKSYGAAPFVPLVLVHLGRLDAIRPFKAAGSIVDRGFGTLRPDMG